MIPMLAMCAFVIELISINVVCGSISNRDGDARWFMVGAVNGAHPFSSDTGQCRCRVRV